jgi:hypothetical protein
MPETIKIFGVRFKIQGISRLLFVILPNELPMLILRAEHSVVMSLPEAEEMTRRAPNAWLMESGGARHFLMLGKPAEVAAQPFVCRWATSSIVNFENKRIADNVRLLRQIRISLESPGSGGEVE